MELPRPFNIQSILKKVCNLQPPSFNARLAFLFSLACTILTLSYTGMLQSLPDGNQKVAFYGAP